MADLPDAEVNAVAHAIARGEGWVVDPAHDFVEAADDHDPRARRWVAIASDAIAALDAARAASAAAGSDGGTQ